MIIMEEMYKMIVFKLYPKEIITRAIMIMTDMPDGAMVNLMLP